MNFNNNLVNYTLTGYIMPSDNTYYIVYRHDRYLVVNIKLVVKLVTKQDIFFNIVKL